MAGHTLYAVKLDATLIHEITEGDLPTNIEVVGEINSGSVYPEKKSIRRIMPGHVFSTMDLTGMLTKLGVPTTFWWKFANLGYFAYGYALDSGGTRLGSTSHKQFNALQGIVVPRRLSVSHDADAVLSCEAVFTYNGSNEMFVMTESVTLPSSVGEKFAFRMGPVTIGNGTTNFTVLKKTSLDLDFGIRLHLEHTDSDPRPKDVSIMQVEPSLTLRSQDQHLIKDTAGIPLTGLKLLNANTLIYLRKRDPDGGIDIADGTSAHISIVTQGVATIRNAQAARRGEQNEVEAVLDLMHDGTNLPLVINTGVAIT